MTMPVRSVRVRAGIVELDCIVAKSSRACTATSTFYGTIVTLLLSTLSRQIVAT
jgi:hypothetical protein